MTCIYLETMTTLCKHTRYVVFRGSCGCSRNQRKVLKYWIFFPCFSLTECYFMLNQRLRTNLLCAVIHRQRSAILLFVHLIHSTYGWILKEKPSNKNKQKTVRNNFKGSTILSLFKKSQRNQICCISSNREPKLKLLIKRIIVFSFYL